MFCVSLSYVILCFVAPSALDSLAEVAYSFNELICAVLVVLTPEINNHACHGAIVFFFFFFLYIYAP
jgi:hypothetical protein